MLRALNRLAGSLVCWVQGRHRPQPYALRLVCSRCGKRWVTGEDWD